MKYSFFFVAALTLLWACGGNEIPDSEATLIGTLTNATPGDSIFLEELTSENQPVQRAAAAINDEGVFKMAYKPKEVGFFKLSYGEASASLVLEPTDKITINGDANSLSSSYTVDGSVESSRLLRLNNALRITMLAKDTLDRVQQTFAQTQDVNAYQSAQARVQKTNANAYNIIQELINEKPGSLVSLVAVQNLDISRDFKMYSDVANGIGEILPGSDYHSSIKAHVDRNRSVQTGEEAPDIMLNDPNGVPVSLSSLRGKVVLIDFWASWCKPCRRENPNVVRVYNEYKDKGFEVYSVSLDKTKDRWVQAIQEDGLNWTHVSDLAFWNSTAAKLYNVKSIPATFLLDQEGRIIARDLRGPALEAKLAEIFAS